MNKDFDSIIDELFFDARPSDWIIQPFYGQFVEVSNLTERDKAIVDKLSSIPTGYIVSHETLKSVLDKTKGEES